MVMGSPFATSCTNALSTLRCGPSRTKINSYGAPSNLKPDLYSAYSSSMGVCRSPTGTMTDTSGSVLLGVIGNLPRTDALHREAGKVLRAHVAQLIDQFAQRTARHQHQRRAEKNDPRTGQRQGHAAIGGHGDEQ